MTTADELRDMELALHELKVQKKEEDEAIGAARTRVILKLEADYQQTKDSNLSNQTKRSGVAEEMLSTSSDYVESVQKSKDLTEEISLMEIDLRHQTRLYNEEHGSTNGELIAAVLTIGDKLGGIGSSLDDIDVSIQKLG